MRKARAAILAGLVLVSGVAATGTLFAHETGGEQGMHGGMMDGMHGDMMGMMKEMHSMMDKCNEMMDDMPSKSDVDTDV